jgi:hypothetical protein
MVESRRLKILMNFYCSLSRVLPLLVASSLCTVPAAAQEGERGRALRLIAVGQGPPWEEKILNGVRVQQDPPAGSEPPVKVQLTNKEGTEVGDAVTINLDQISQVLPVGPGSVPLHETGKGGLNPVAWHTLKFPTNAAAGLAILWRDPAVGKWTKARSLVLPDDIRSFPAGRVRIVNVSKYTIGLQLGTEKGSLKPGAAILRSGKGGVFAKVPLKLSLKSKSGRWVKVFDQEINQSARERTNVILYAADGEGAVKPVGAVILRESGRTPVVPKKRKR